MVGSPVWSQWPPATGSGDAGGGPIVARAPTRQYLRRRPTLIRRPDIVQRVSRRTRSLPATIDLRGSSIRATIYAKSAAHYSRQMRCSRILVVEDVGAFNAAFTGRQALHIITLLQAYGIAVWLPEAGGPANLDNPTHQALIMMLGHRTRPRRNARLAPRRTRRP